LKYCYSGLSQEVFYETDAVERVEQSQLILTILKMKKEIKGIECYSFLESHIRGIQNVNDLSSQLLLVKNLNEFFVTFDLSSLVNYIKSSSKNQISYFQELLDILNSSVAEALSEEGLEDFEDEFEEEEDFEKESYSQLKEFFKIESEKLIQFFLNLKNKI
jgi:hypothetical protein